MFSVKKNVLQTVALLKAYGVKQIVLSPGSRNAPLIQTFSQDTFFECHTIVDERNAAFYALGIIQALQQPVAVCCTSGSALLNYAPAVSEAYYQQLPLVVISADRSPQWIGQMDGQTLRQTGALDSVCKKSIHLPEVSNSEDEWFCNRLLNEALIACTSDDLGPVHINIPLSEPLFDYSETMLPDVRKIDCPKPQKSVEIDAFVANWKQYPKRLIVVGQSFKNKDIKKILEGLAQETDCVVFVEHLSNCNSPLFIGNFDALLPTLPEDRKSEFTPDLVITLGGHIVSKHLKQFLRKYKPKNHWHLTPSGEVVDLFQSLTHLVEADSVGFLTQLAAEAPLCEEMPFYRLWKSASELVPSPSINTSFTDIAVIGAFLKQLPAYSALHIANSSAVRTAQLFQLDESISVYCNRGVNGIEGTIPTVIGFASVYKDPVYLITGDLSFFYGLNALWNIQHLKNLRILLINNGGGGIFRQLPGLNESASLREYVSADHQTTAKDWAWAAGLNYLSVKNQEFVGEVFTSIFDSETDRSVLVEVVL